MEMATSPYRFTRIVLLKRDGFGYVPSVTMKSSRVATTLVACLAVLCELLVGAGPSTATPAGTAGTSASASAVGAGAMTPDERWIRSAYEDFLQRAPRQEEVSRALTELQNGNSRDDVVMRLATSPQWALRTVTDFYLSVLGRAPDPGGLDGWAASIVFSQRTVAQVAAAFYASPEYYQRLGGTDTAWVRDLYSALLHREPDSAGFSFWVARTATHGRESVAYDFYQSLESRNTRVAHLYGIILRRAPEPVGLNYWAEQLQDRSDVQIAGVLASSAEYHQASQWRFGQAVTIVRVTTGAVHSCVTTSTGDVRCWGNNEHGQLGTSGDSSTAPVRVRSVTGSVTAGGFQTCVTTAQDGWCWGHIVNFPTVMSPQISPELAGAQAIALGYSHSCLVSAAGAASCWGNNQNAQLGNGTTSPSPDPHPVTGLDSGVSDITVGRNHSCAVQARLVSCWGNGFLGQLGDGGGTSSLSTTPSTVAGVTGATSVSAGRDHTCATTVEGTLYCWGANQKGQVGSGHDSSSPVPATAVVGIPSPVIAVAAQLSGTCALTSEGAVYCWGSNYLGQLGNGQEDSIPHPTPGLVQGLESGVEAISAGNDHACALQSGRVLCWGQNFNGQVGDGGTSNSRLVPRPVVGF